MARTEQYLKTAPHIVVEQGVLGDDNWESPIDVVYYSRCISLEQDGNDINLSYSSVKELFKTIQKFTPEALNEIKKRHP